MLFVINPQVVPFAPTPVYDPEEAYLEAKRQEYIAALEQQRQRRDYERALALEEQRHRATLAALSQHEALRRQASGLLHRGDFYQQQQQPAPAEDVRRVRFARQQEREQARRNRSRDLQEKLVNDIFGSIFGRPDAAAEQPVSYLKESIWPLLTSHVQSAATTSKPSRAAENNEEAHWSTAPERAKSIAEISEINRIFSTLKNMFVFPQGPLDRMTGSEAPRLAFNATNASIHAYENALSELLTKLDAVESFGFKGVREARKQLVVKIEKELEELEKAVSERLANSPSPVVVPDVIVPIEGPEEPEETTKQSSEDVVMDSAKDAAPVEGYDVEVDDTYADVVVPAEEEHVLEKTEVGDAVMEEQTVPEEVAAPTNDVAQPEESTQPASTELEVPAPEHQSDSDIDSEIEDAVRVVASPEEHDADAEFEML